jgi:hypothetical protein
MTIVNILVFFLIFNFYSLIVLLSGYFFKQRFFAKDKINLGETLVFGFLFIYILVTIIHFIIPISSKVSLIFYSIFLLYGAKNFKEISFFLKENFHKSFLIAYFLCFLTSITSNLHDDWSLYQLPIIKSMQEFKIVFGLISLNDYFGQGHSFYELMSIFQLPIFANTAIYLLPIIFLMSFIFFLFSEKKEISNNFIKLFIYFIFLLLLFRYTRSKEYGTDIVVISLIFMVQIYVFQFLYEKKDDSLLKKTILFIPFAIFLKLYAALITIYIFIFFIILKKDFFLKILKFKKLNLLIFAIIFLSLGKNLIVSGCFFYQLKNVCIDKEIAEWSIGNKAANERHIYTTASSRGWKAYVRSIEHERFVSPQEYLKLSKYTYPKYLAQDKDFERFLILIVIIAITLLINLRFFKKNGKENSLFILIFLFILPVIIWFLKIPHVRFGANAYLSFMCLGILSLYFDLIKINKKYLSYLLIIGVIFFTSKNFKRIYSEIKNNRNVNYPFADYKSEDFETFNVGKGNVNVPKNSLWCGNIPMLCASKNYLISDIKIKNNYIFLISEEKNIIKFINRTSHYDMIEMNDNLKNK